MKNIDLWQPTKFVIRRGKLQSSHNKKHVGTGSRLFANRIAAFYDEAIPVYVQGEVIDLGCGAVPLYGIYKQFASSVTCLDWPEDNSKSPFVDILHDLNTPLPLSESTFDTAILSDVLEHIYKPEQLLAEINRILRVNGTLLLNVPFMYWLHEKPYDYFRYSEFALTKMLEENGFTIEKFAFLGGSLEIFFDLLAKISVRVPYIGNFLAAIIYYKSAIVCNSRFGKKLSEKSSRTFPLGYGIVARKTVTV
jgi:SAM-dependent methyltransferase